MNAPAFTPGPWEARSGSLHRQHWLIDAPGRRFIATIDGPPDKEGEANGRLIALAPELFELAELAVANMEQSLAFILESHCLLNDQLEPIPETLEEDAREEVDCLEREIASAKALLARVAGQ